MALNYSSCLISSAERALVFEIMRRGFESLMRLIERVALAILVAERLFGERHCWRDKATGKDWD